MQILLWTVVQTCRTKLAAFIFILFRTRIEAKDYTEMSATQLTALWCNNHSRK